MRALLRASPVCALASASERVAALTRALLRASPVCALASASERVAALMTHFCALHLSARCRARCSVLQRRRFGGASLRITGLRVACWCRASLTQRRLRDFCASPDCALASTLERVAAADSTLHLFARRLLSPAEHIVACCDACHGVPVAHEMCFAKYKPTCRGLYDPILDDSEDIYVPIGPDELDQGSNIQEFRQVQIETKQSTEQTKTDIEYEILDASKPYKPFGAGTLEEPIILNLNYKDVFPELTLDELPPETKYKLPVSEQYDPEGKRVKQKAVFYKNVIVDFEKIKKLAEQKDVKQMKEISFKQDVSDKSFIEKKEILEIGRDQHLSILEEESDLHKIKQTAKQIIEESVSKAVSVANQLKNKSEFKLNESLFYEDSEAISKTQKISKQDVSDKSFIEKKEILEIGRDQHLSILEEESDLRKIKQTAKQIIEESLSKAVSVANQLKNKSEFKLNEPLFYEDGEAVSKTQKISKQSLQQSNKEKVKLTKRVSFEDDHYKVQDEEISSKVASKREIRVADEIKKFEAFDIQMDSTLNAEERKLLTRQDIDEAIEAGTVRQRTGMFKTGTEKIKTDKLDKKIVDTVKIDIKTDIELAKQRVYNVGLQVIPRIRTSVQSSRQSTLLLKRFLLQMTKVMINIYKLIPVEKRYRFSKTSYEKRKEDHEYIHEIHYDDSDIRKDKIIDGVEEIRKPKLSGAKIAQIEGLKPAELTDRMNIVISEFLRKTGQEERYDDKEFHTSQTSTSKRESRTNDEFSNDASFSKKVFDERPTGDEFMYGSSFKGKTFDKSKRESNEFSEGHPFREESFDTKKLFEEIYETKTQSYEVREMKEEKRYSESKTKYDSKMPSYDTESTSRDDVTVPLTYIAIVEAHVYTNKNAIFEEQMRRMSESVNQSDVKESGIIYYRCEVSVFYRQFREPSLPPTVVIESIEEIPAEQVFEEEKQELLQTCETTYEDTAKKLAVQKISEVIEPLLNIKQVMSVNIKQAYPAIETPLKLISEQTTVTMEKEENILQESKLVEKSLISIEKPVKSIVETSEIKEEERSEFIEMIETEERKPKPLLEPSQAIAETIEIFTEEETVGMVDIPQPIVQIPQPVKVERGIKSVAETSEIIVHEADLDILDVSKTISASPRYTIADHLKSIAETMIAIIQEPKSENRDVVKITEETVKVGVNEIVASEVFEVFPEEPVYEEVIQSETKRRHSDVFLEKSVLVLPETTSTSVEEPICEEFIISKAQKKEAKVDIDAKVVAEVTEISLIEKEQDTFDVVKIIPKEPGALKEKSVLSVGETATILPFEPPVEPFDSIKAFNQQASISIEESKATEITVTQVEEPNEKNVEVLDFTAKHTQPFIEEKYLTAAETFTILPEEPKVAFEINENLKQQAHVEVVELKTATVSSVTVEEPRHEAVEIQKVIDKEANTDIEASILTVAENTIILAEGPHHGNLEIPQIETKRPRALIEGGLIVAETILVSPTSPETDFNLMEKINKQANIMIEESKAITTSLVQVEEPKEEELELLQYLKKQPQTLLQDSLLPVATTVEILPEGPKDENLIILKPVEEKADIDIEELKTASVTVVSVEEPKNENIKKFTYKEKEFESLLEKPVRNAAETFAIVPEGPLCGRFEAPAITGDKANVILEEIKPLTISTVTPNEPQEITVDVPYVKDFKPQTLIEDHFLPVVETIAVVPDEPKGTLTVVSTTSEQADVKMREFKGTNITVVYSEEPREENLKLPIVEVKQQQPVLEAVHLTAAETSLLLSEESKTTFDVTQTTSQQAHIEIIEQKATEGSLVFPLESKDKDLVIEEIVQKTPKILLESPVLIAAENSIITFEEKVKELTETIKPASLKATTYLEGLKLPNTIIIFSEEPKLEIIEAEKLDKKESQHTIVPIVQPVAVVTVIHTSEVETEFTVLSKLLSKECKLTYEAFTPVFHSTITIYEDAADYTNKRSKVDIQAKVLIVESTAIAVAKSTFVNVIIDKEEIVDVSKYIVELAEEQEEKKAALEITKEVTVDIKDIDLSSASSTISSAPSSPFTQEYVFGFTVGHEYRVQSPQETELHIVKPAKDLYGVGKADTSYTLTFEAAYEDEKEILHMEEFSDVVKKNQFWISDVKTMEIIESSDARMKLTNVSMDVEARKVSQKSVSFEDSSVGIKSRSQSFDTAADFEISLQSSEQLETKKTQISDVQAVATFDLKSEASFKTLKDVESQAKVSIKSKSSKYSAQSVDVAYGLTIENEIVVNGQSVELDLQTLQESKTATSKSTKRRVKKGTKSMALATSETDIEASYDYEAGMNLESKSISKESYSTLEGSVESRSVAEGSYTALQGSLESRSIAKESHLAMEGSLESRSIAKGSYTAIDESLESRSIAKGSYTAIDESLESRSIAKGSYTAMDGSLESRSIAKGSFTAMDGSLESRSIAKGSYAKMEANLEANSVSEASYLAMEGKHETSSVSTGGYVGMDASLESRNLSKSSYAAVEGKLESGSISAASYSSQQASLESRSSKSIEMDASQKISIQKGLSEISQAGATMNQQKLLLQMDLKSKARDPSGIKSPSPEEIPSPLRDVYIFRLNTPAPEETTFVPRDCSFTPESVHDDEVVIVNGMIPHIDTKIVRVLYSPPLETPPISPARRTEPVFTKPGLKGGSETPESLKGFKSGSHTPEFTKEDLLEINRKSALLASAIDKTIRSIEEYKQSVGIATEIEKTEMSGEKEEGRLNVEEEERLNENEAVKLEKDGKIRKAKSKKAELDVRKAENKSRKSILSRFTQI